MHYLWLLAAIVSEVIATSALNATNGFHKLGPSLIVVAGYGLAFFLLSQALRSMSVGIAYAIWSGLGTVLIALAGKILYKQGLDAAALFGMSLIIAGVLVMNLFSKSVAR